MDDLYYKIKIIIQSKPCPTHNLHPLVKFDDGIIDINCCCGPFKVMCIAEINELLKETNNIKSVSPTKKRADD